MALWLCGCVAVRLFATVTVHSQQINTDVSRAYVPSEFEAPVAFYFGVIDILQRWTWGKVAERTVKRVLKCLDGNGLSAIEPKRYQQRVRAPCVGRDCAQCAVRPCMCVFCACACVRWCVCVCVGVVVKDCV